MSNEGIFPCIQLENFSTCNFSNWDTLLIELTLGGILALIFFTIQHRNTKLVNLVFKQRIEYAIKNSINSLLWMKSGLENMDDLLKREKGYLFSLDVIKINKTILSDACSLLYAHNDLLTKDDFELLDTINKDHSILGDKLNEKYSMFAVNIKNNFPYDATFRGSIISINSNIDKLANKFQIEKFGKPPYDEYARSFFEKTDFQLKHILQAIAGVFLFMIFAEVVFLLLGALPFPNNELKFYYDSFSLDFNLLIIHLVALLVISDFISVTYSIHKIFIYFNKKKIYQKRVSNDK